MAIATINPATGKTLKTFQPFTEDEVESKLRHAYEAFLKHRTESFAARSAMMRKAADILESEKDRWGSLMVLEMGKPIVAARQEAEKCARVCRFYADNAEKFLSDEVVPTSASRSYVRYEPLGTILAVMPWNFPFWQVFRFASPALMAGNVGLLKHASNVPQCAIAIEEIFRRAGFPEGVFQTLLIGSDQVQRVLEDPTVKAATLTGSEPAGRSVASLAGKLIKKTVLELGGSDPFIVMPSADLGEAVAVGIKARTVNNGQSCIAAKRFIVHDKLYDAFRKLFVEQMERLVVGDPMDERTNVGPLATLDGLETLDEQVRTAVESGARLLTGGKKLRRQGYFYAPTVLENIPSDTPAYSEELFGPVALLFRVKSAEEAVHLANDTPFGLGSSVWTSDPKEREFFLRNLDAGSVFFNAMVASDPQLPFGGVKNSGYGRELSAFGIREFVNVKTVWIKESA
ncbi:MAG TPA: NAD-dependent succinate-semialdehyde dehydrogenase [Bacteroidota bacterium]|nr:NAD-dependent succinate-semialdehyde dehydrogenase [Bacteroidota bacterium]